MDLKTYLSAKTKEEREEFAAKCESTLGHIQNVMYGIRPCAADLAVHIFRESDGLVTRWELRPLDWHKFWPELIGSEGAPEVPTQQPTATQVA